MNKEELTLRPIEHEDMKSIFDWRNDIEVRKNSFNSESIPWETHEKWFHSIIQDRNITAYIALDRDHEKIGVARFELQTPTIKINVMVNPVFIGKGFGRKLVELATKRYVAEKQPKEKIIAEIRTDNIASIKTFQKSGYKKSHITFVYNGG